MTENARVASKFLQLQKSESWWKSKPSKLVSDRGRGQDLQTYKNALLRRMYRSQEVHHLIVSFFRCSCASILRDVPRVSRGRRAGNAGRFSVTSNATKYRGKITSLSQILFPCLHFTSSIHHIRGLRDPYAPRSSRRVCRMRYLLEIIASVAALLAGKDSVLTSVQIYPNGTYPGAIDPAAEPGAQFLQTSPPFYPSPWMNGQGEWADAYAQAKDFVSQLTLLEKVNLTTGVGWEGEQCVGQVKISNLHAHIKF